MTGSIMPAGTGAHPDAAHGLARSAPKIPGLEAIINRYASVGLDPRLHRTESPLPRSLAARLQVLAPVDVGLADFLDQLEAALSDPSRYEDSLSEDGEMDPDTPVQFAPAGMAQSCMQALVDDFSRRQRQATMLVAGCITVSCILTFVGIAAIGSFAASAAADKVASQTRLSSAATWSKPEDAVPSISLVAASPNRAGKSDALLLPARLASSAGVAGSQAPAFVLMQAGRPLALGPIIAARQASYLLIRGLPDEASLSSGQRKPSGAWLVRSDDLSALTLSFADDASGDYTADVYALGSAPAAQGRQRLVFRVEQGLGQVAATAPGRAAAMPDLTTPPPARAMPAPGSA